MKTIGIMADNYKLDKFKEELTSAGYHFSIRPFKILEDKISKITITCRQNQVEEIR